MRRPRQAAAREGVQSREAAHLVQQYLGASPRSPGDLVSGGGALRRGARRGLPGGEGLQRQASTPVRGGPGPPSMLLSHAEPCG